MKLGRSRIEDCYRAGGEVGHSYLPAVSTSKCCRTYEYGYKLFRAMEVFVMVRRQKSTVFLTCREGDTVTEVKKMLAAICRQEVEGIRLFQDEDGKG